MLFHFYFITFPLVYRSQCVFFFLVTKKIKPFIFNRTRWLVAFYRCRMHIHIQRSTRRGAFNLTEIGMGSNSPIGLYSWLLHFSYCRALRLFYGRYFHSAAGTSQGVLPPSPLPTLPQLSQRSNPISHSKLFIYF